MGALAAGVILVYAAILIAGGFAGWRVSGSRISLTAGLASAALLAIAYRLSHLHPLAGYSMAIAASLALTVMFALRFRKTGKFFPAGIMSAISGVVFVFLGWLTAFSR
ncbi:MAG: hypothetical protein A3J28_07015 [Acidobacteria bacterium RIFCSPLOWO2_12_FULL_60_22]|nr:MAG: hypothetical protein A3J28_07015 [Acidobacteria bacterium RIFCSPLOWO2_12_FULL_60_22]